MKARYTPPACRLLSVSAKHDALARIDVCKYPRQGRACGKGARLGDVPLGTDRFLSFQVLCRLWLRSCITAALGAHAFKFCLSWFVQFLRRRARECRVGSAEAAVKQARLQL